MAEAETAIKSRLEVNTSNLASATAIFAILAPQKSPRPYLTFKVLDENPTNVMGKETAPTDCLFSVSIFAETVLEIVAVTNDIRSAFNRFSGTADSVVVQDVFYEGRNDFFDEADRDYQRVIDFRMFYEE